MEKSSPSASDGNPAPNEPAPDAFATFKAFAGKLVKVPKAEIDKREAEYQKAQAKKKAKRGPGSKGK